MMNCAVRRCGRPAEWKLVVTSPAANFDAYYCDEHLDLSSRVPTPDMVDAGAVIRLAVVRVASGEVGES